MDATLRGYMIALTLAHLVFYCVSVCVCVCVLYRYNKHNCIYK